MAIDKVGCSLYRRARSNDLWHRDQGSLRRLQDRVAHHGERLLGLLVLDKRVGLLVLDKRIGLLVLDKRVGLLVLDKRVGLLVLDKRIELLVRIGLLGRIGLVELLGRIGRYVHDDRLERRISIPHYRRRNIAWLLIINRVVVTLVRRIIERVLEDIRQRNNHSILPDLRWQWIMPRQRIINRVVVNLLWPIIERVLEDIRRRINDGPRER